MRKMQSWILVGLLAGGLSACSTTQTAEDALPAEDSVEVVEEESVPEVDVEESAIRMALSLAAEGDHRSEENRARNHYRNPVETLEFFGLQADQTVVELSPGRGWYTEVLAPVLAAEGRLIAGAFQYDPEDVESYRTQIGESYVALLASSPGIYSRVEMGIFEPPQAVELAEAGTADLVVSFRNFHGWHNRGMINDAMAEVYDVLKPGGVFGVVMHRAAEGSDPDETAPQGYLSEEYVVTIAEAAGFVLDGRSEINANPRDTKDYEHGVWSLPPTLRGGEETAAQYLEIGESDRMTLRFKKPAEGALEASE